MKTKIGEVTFITIDGRHFYCKCGSNLFTKQEKNIYECNGCGQEYEGES